MRDIGFNTEQVLRQHQHKSQHKWDNHWQTFILVEKLLHLMAQLVERSLPIPEVRGSNLVKKKPCMAHFFKKQYNMHNKLM